MISLRAEGARLDEIMYDMAYFIFEHPDRSLTVSQYREMQGYTDEEEWEAAGRYNKLYFGDPCVMPLLYIEPC